MSAGRLRKASLSHMGGLPLESHLYEPCPSCKGVGSIPAEPVPRRCLACKPIHVVPIGLTVGQVERMARREREHQEDRARGLRHLVLVLDAADHDAIQAELARRQAGSRAVDPDGPTLVPEGESNLAGALLAECVRDLDEYRAIHPPTPER